MLLQKHPHTWRRKPFVVAVVAYLYTSPSCAPLVTLLRTQRRGTNREFYVGWFTERMALGYMDTLCFPRPASQFEELVRCENL